MSLRIRSNSSEINVHCQKIMVKTLTAGTNQCQDD